MNEKMKRMNQPEDPNMTMDVNNDELENLIKAYSERKTGESLNKLLTHIHGCRVLVPANLNEKKQPVPCFIKSKNEELFLPIYTSKGQIPKEPKSQVIMNMPFMAVNQMAVRPEVKATGIVVNPFSDNLVFKEQLLQKIDEVDKARKNAPKGKTMQLTPAQYMKFERKQYEFGFLPKKFFAEGSSFIDELCEKKEEYIDRLYEEAYQQKRLYPYLPEDFSVMVMDISEELLIVRVDFPTRDMENGSCFRVYLTWNANAGRGRYFTIEKGAEYHVLGEIASDWKHLNYGAAPAEGAELQRLIDLIGDEKRHTS